MFDFIILHRCLNLQWIKMFLHSQAVPSSNHRLLLSILEELHYNLVNNSLLPKWSLMINVGNGRGRLVQWKNTRFVKIFVRGDRGSIPAERSFFSDHKTRLCLMEIPNTIGRVLPITQPWSRKISCCDNLLLYEEERSLGNWSYDVILESGTTSHTLLRNSTLIFNQHCNLWRHHYKLNLRRSH